MRKAGVASLAVAMLLMAAPAHAETPAAGAGSTIADPTLNGITAWGILSWANGLGIGGRYMLPVMNDGLLQNPNFKDRLAAEFGLDYVRWSVAYAVGWDYSWNIIRPTAGLAWTFWLNDQLALYPKLDLGYEIGWLSGWDDSWGATPTRGFYWEVLGGVMYKAGGVTLRAELGNVGLKAGVGFGF